MLCFSRLVLRLVSCPSYTCINPLLCTLSCSSEASSDEDAGADARGEGGEAGPLLLVREVSPAEASKQAEEVQTMWEFAGECALYCIGWIMSGL